MHLGTIDDFCDLVPRAWGRQEEIGPFTLFVPGAGQPQLYARPSRAAVDHTFTAQEVAAVVARQAELGLPPALEWIGEVTPRLHPAVEQVRAHTAGTLAQCPLLGLPPTVDLELPPATTVRILQATSPELAEVAGAVHAGFGETDQAPPRDTFAMIAALEAGELVVAGAFDSAGRAVGGGSAPRRIRWADCPWVATPPPPPRLPGMVRCAPGDVVTDLAEAEWAHAEGYRDTARRTTKAPAR